MFDLGSTRTRRRSPNGAATNQHMASSSRHGVLSEANVRAVGGLTKAEQEEELLKKMQTLSHLLGQVDSALEGCPSTRDGSRPPTGASQPPPSRRGLASANGAPPGSAGPLVIPPGTSSSSRGGTGRIPTGGGAVGILPGGTAASAVSSSGRSVNLRGTPSESPQLAIIHESEYRVQTPAIEFVTYTGVQGGHNLNQGRRRVESSATKSSMGSIFGGEP